MAWGGARPLNVLFNLHAYRPDMSRPRGVTGLSRARLSEHWEPQRYLWSNYPPTLNTAKMIVWSRSSLIKILFIWCLSLLTFCYFYHWPQNHQEVLVIPSINVHVSSIKVASFNVRYEYMYY